MHRGAGASARIVGRLGARRSPPSFLRMASALAFRIAADAGDGMALARRIVSLRTRCMASASAHGHWDGSNGMDGT